MKYIVVTVEIINGMARPDVVGIFEDKAMAEMIVDVCRKEYSFWDGGVNIFESFPMPEINVVKKNYLPAFFQKP